MRKPTTSPPPKILFLSLAFLLAGLFGCSQGSQGEQAGAKPAAAPAGGTSSAAPSTAPPAGGAATTGAAAPANSANPANAAAGTAPGAPPQQEALPQDKIPEVVAKVNGTPIKKELLVKTADQVHKQMMPNAPQTAEFYRRVLDNLVTRELLLQEAKKTGVVVSDEEVTKQVGELKNRFPSPEKFQQELKNEGMTEADLMQTAHDAYMVQKLVEGKVVADIKVSDAEEKDFYDKNQAQLKRPEQVHVRHILIKADKDMSPADKEKAKAKAASLLARIKDGGDFAKLATENSDDPGSKQSGGTLPPFGKGQMVPQFEAAAFALTKPNELSPVVETQYGYHIIQLIELQPAGVVPFADVKDRIGEFLKQKQKQEKLEAHVKVLKSEGKVEIFI
jgi:peptidyl-prolyl cis-trans isomerase C